MLHLLFELTDKTSLIGKTTVQVNLSLDFDLRIEGSAFGTPGRAFRPESLDTYVRGLSITAKLIGLKSCHRCRPEKRLESQRDLESC